MKLLKLLTMTSRLANLQRFSMERLSHPESVLEHTGFVALISLVLASEVDVNLETTVAYALVHDLDEVFVGDVARPTKYSSESAKRMFDDLAAMGVGRIAGELVEDFPNFAGSLPSDHAGAKHGREGLIVAIADVLAVVHTVWGEVLVRGNCAMLRQAFTAADQVKKLRARIATEFAGKDADCLNSILDDAHALMTAAQEYERPILATVMEDIVRAN